ncbi:nuclear envelope integral membrane protein 2 isoform X2 [Arvicola amphibius]|uniref:nuclear envelope integral membrane protein 2 isoform X2 n=1 Tax=Arvicola amphibius TaxID=1047088 RepID=UPI0018E3DD9B|nr:nuclear envelope integral membrane protein 2 isoform X2 [Arvicola amphibius]
MTAGPWWLVLWMPLLATLPAGAVQQEEEAVMAAPRCKSLKEADFIETSMSDCYCYNQEQIQWTYMWSTVQVTVASPGLLRFVYITGSRNCQHPETILSFVKCVIHNFWAPEELKGLIMVFSPYGETVCFSVNPIGRVSTYIVSVDRNTVDLRLLLLFVAGIFLFFSAKTLSQSPVFYYSSGTVLGVLMTLVFVLLMAKRHIPKYSTFGALMIGCWFASVYVGFQLTEDLKRLWCGHRLYVLGYFLVVGLCSFAACYWHGPLASEWSRGLLMWTLRSLSLVLLYMGVAVPQFAYVVMGLLLFSRSLRHPLRALSYLRWKMRPWFSTEPPVVKFLTEDEYREQAEAETASALEELRRACCRPDFPSWLAVSRLQAPKKFADFILGASHLSPEEVSTHERQYGLGGAFLEEQLFSLQADSQPAS